MKTMIRKPGSIKEKGIGIIFSIGLLMLISVLVLTYILTSTINHKSAKNYKDLTVARMLVKSAVNRAMIAMKLYSGDLNNLKSTYNNNAGAASGTDDEDLAVLLPTTVKGIDYYTTATYEASAPKPKWHYIKVKDGTSTDKIIGRIAFAVTEIAPESGWIMPTATVDSGQTTAQYYINIGKKSGSVKSATEFGSPAAPPSPIRQVPVTSTAIDGSEIIGRPGRDVNEIWLGIFDFLTDSQLMKMSSIQAPPGGKMPITGWGSSDAYFAALGITDEATKNQHLQYFSFGNPADKEAFWIDNNADETKDDDELYHRFNIARTNWDNLTVDSILSSPTPYSSTYNESSVTSIPWLNNWKTAGGMSSIDACKKQIAANLIDYADVNSAATTDSEDAPTYVGLEKCPYINEIKIKFVCNVTAQDLTTYRRYQAQADPEFLWVELVNMYDIETDPSNYIDIKATVKMDWEFTVAGTTYTRTGSDSDQAEILMDNANACRYSAPADKFNDQSWHTTAWVDTDSTLAECNKIESIKIKSLTVKLENNDDGTFYDFSYILDSDLVIDSDITGSETYFQTSVADPRQNLLATDWLDSAYGPTEPGTIGSKNDNFAPNPGGSADAEPEAAATEQPWDLSTAYIRNAPMLSPWELGAIHRGTAWQTLNLKKYNTTEGMSGGGDAYNSGDANILDQIKMTTNTTTPGKINLNTTEPLILKTLFYGIYTHSGYEDPGEQDNAPLYLLTETSAETLADTVIAEQTFKTRAEVLSRITLFSDNSLDPTILQQTNDATKEEIIGKFINLTRADAITTSQLRIIAVTQTIDDVGDNIQGANYGIYDQGIDKITATQKVLIILYENPETNELGIRRFEYVEND